MYGNAFLKLMNKNKFKKKFIFQQTRIYVGEY